MDEQQEQRVVIEGREFVLGATYAPVKRGKRCRRLVGFEPDAAGWRGGLVRTMVSGSGQGRDWPEKVSGVWWARWAGAAMAAEAAGNDSGGELSEGRATSGSG